MYPMKDFLTFDIGDDPYVGVRAAVKLDDLPLKEKVTPKLSIMMSCFHRYSQLQRTLETLCRQDFKNFEVLIYDNDDDQHLEEVVAQFDKYLHIKFFKKSGGERRFDPSCAFKYMYPYTEGEVIAIMQPECMLYRSATYWLYYGHWDDELNGINVYNIENALEAPIKDFNAETCVTLKTLWSSPRMQRGLDLYDWHDDIKNLYDMPGFWDEGCGLANFSNKVWCYDYDIQIWWLVFSFKRTASIWEDMPELYGHASIDFFMINYREIMNYIDVMPYKPLAFHQDHHRMSVSPEGDQESVSKEELRRKFLK